MLTDNSSHEKQCAELCRCGCLTTVYRWEMRHVKCQQTGGLYPTACLCPHKESWSNYSLSQDLCFEVQSVKCFKIPSAICNRLIWAALLKPSCFDVHKLTYRANRTLLQAEVHCLRLLFWIDAHDYMSSSESTGDPIRRSPDVRYMITLSWMTCCLVLIYYKLSCAFLSSTV